ncbi:class II histone deacetylase [Roseibacterium beibuensis]|uniref:Class II histone deacetylase n=1 Tax=[Roseibacterium] beibuensis TaxID=1193142 RepID=A0ABP9KSS9_9RHOB|nr:class II histone deacetylase [Roseibacterium beibuensis]MCS6622279.1 class II histone deacetylase [Roseibacterium beibuensis]
MRTGFFWDERCFWHSGGNYAFLLPVGGLVQPAAAGGLPENPETKRRLKNLLDVTGLLAELDARSADPVTEADLLRVHPPEYVDAFREAAASGGGELGLRTPFGPDGFDTASLSAGLAKSALFAVLQGDLDNAYALSRPPGHHCLPDFPNGFCLLANIAIAVEAAFDARMVDRVAVIDWDVHHGNGTEAIFYDRDDVLTISLHQERNYPADSGAFEDRGTGAGEGYNLNIPLPPGGGHRCYIEAMERLVIPQLQAFQPDAIIVACGFDASGVDPLSRMLAGSNTFREMTEMVMAAASDLCDGRLVLVHEGGYSEAHVPFCGHAVIEALSGSAITAEDPLAHRIGFQQPGPRFDAYCSQIIAEMEDALG